MSWNTVEADFAQVYGKKGDPSQGDQMKNQQKGRPAWCQKAASIRGQYKIPGCNEEEDQKVCIKTKFGSLCADAEDEKVCVTTKFGSVCASAE